MKLQTLFTHPGSACLRPLSQISIVLSDEELWEMSTQETCGDAVLNYGVINDEVETMIKQSGILLNGLQTQDSSHGGANQATKGQPSD